MAVTALCLKVKTLLITGSNKHQSEGPIDALNMYKQTDRIVKKAMTHQFTSFTSSGFIVSPFVGSPLHLNQNFNFLFLSSDGFLPNNEAPGISYSVRLELHILTSVAMFNVRLSPWPY